MNKDGKQEFFKEMQELLDTYGIDQCAEALCHLFALRQEEEQAEECRKCMSQDPCMDEEAEEEDEKNQAEDEDEEEECDETEAQRPISAFKIVKPGRFPELEKNGCGPVSYTMDGPAELHRRGFHAALDPEVLFTWYKHTSWKECKVYLVTVWPDYQIGTIRGGGRIVATNHIIFEKELSWTDVMDVLRVLMRN